MATGSPTNPQTTTPSDTPLPEQNRVVQTDAGAKDGQTKCPKCGATDISTNAKKGLLRCNFCRHEFQPEKLSGMETDLKNLKGQVTGSGATNIIADTKDVLTLKCESCGAEVVIDTASAAQSRCHWCRNTLSINQQIPNGAIPDAVLPFNITKEDARTAIETFVGKRKFFAHPTFRAEFTTENIMGVYFPYMVVDANAHVNLSGQGEHQTRAYTRGSGDSRKTYYDADLYHVEREYDLVIDGLSIESSSERLERDSTKTNNIINSIMPFDVENCVKYNANYLKGYTSERRDVNIDELKPLVEAQSRDIARFAINDSLKEYNRGVRWESENYKLVGQQWKAAYLPVWLYSYQQVSGDKKLLHYVAVNARTKETMGSVPVHFPKLFGISFLVELGGLLSAFLLSFIIDSDYIWLLLLSGVIYFAAIYLRYRNTDARHTYETETKTEVSNLRKVDQFLQSLKGLRNPKMNGANHHLVKGATTAPTKNNELKSTILELATDGNPIAEMFKPKEK